MPHHRLFGFPWVRGFLSMSSSLKDLRRSCNALCASSKDALSRFHLSSHSCVPRVGKVPAASLSRFIWSSFFFLWFSSSKRTCAGERNGRPGMSPTRVVLQVEGLSGGMGDRASSSLVASGVQGPAGARPGGARPRRRWEKGSRRPR